MAQTRSSDAQRSSARSARQLDKGNKATATSKSGRTKAAQSATFDASDIDVSDAAMATYKLVHSKLAAKQKAAQEARDMAVRARNRALLDAEEGDGPPQKKKKMTAILSDDEEDMAAGLETIKAVARRQLEAEDSAREEESDADASHPGVNEDEDLHTDLDGIDMDDADVDMDLASQDGDLNNEIGIGNRAAPESLATSHKSRSRLAIPTTPQAKVKSSSTPSTVNGSKVVEKDFTPRTLKLALVSKSHVRTRTIYDEPFPRNNKIARINFAWKTIKESALASEDVEVRQAFKRATVNTDIKGKLMKFTLYGRTGLVSSIISKARDKVRTYYGFAGDTESVRKDVEWLLKDSHFVYGGIDLRERTVDLMQPFGAQLIVDIIEAQWFPSTSRSKLDLETTNKIYQKRDLPLTVILLVVTAIEHALKEWSANGRKAVQITFSEETAKLSYERHLRHWKFFESQMKAWPAWWRKTVLARILANHSNFDLNTDDNDFANLDFGALDKLAEEAKEGKEMTEQPDARLEREYREAAEIARAAREAREAREFRRAQSDSRGEAVAEEERAGASKEARKACEPGRANTPLPRSQAEASGVGSLSESE